MTFNIINNPVAVDLTVANGSNFGGDNLTTLAGTGLSLIIDGSQTTGAIQVQFNGLDSAVFTLNTGQTWGWGYQDIQFTSVDFQNSSGSSQTVQIVVGVVVA